MVGRHRRAGGVLDGPLPESVRSSVEAYVGCIAGAAQQDEYLQAIRDAGFVDVEVVGATPYPADMVQEVPEVRQAIAAGIVTADEVAAAADAVVSAKITAVKP
ncbi:MAG: hypothetical protein O7A98_07410 [Acidobacteria bacterium]|nr:hypothetical protein [Acidobacteriota bacterium]